MKRTPLSADEYRQLKSFIRKLATKHRAICPHHEDQTDEMLAQKMFSAINDIAPFDYLCRKK